MDARAGTVFAFSNDRFFATMAVSKGIFMKLSNSLAALLLVASVASANAQTIKPGLWEFATQMRGGSGQMADAMAQAQKQLENMPPEQRKMIQDMMAKQGVQIGASDGGGVTVKVCMTQEMVDRNEVSSHRVIAHHQQSTVGNTMKFAFVCQTTKQRRGLVISPAPRPTA
jgi:hypothetical protein